jgi:hypothetical protein
MVLRLNKKRILGATCVLVALAHVSPATGNGKRQNSSADARALIERVIASQHKNDEVLAEYERQERRQVLKHDKELRVAEDKTHRVVPTGTGTLRLLVEENGRAVPPEVYHKELRDLEQALLWALNPSEAKQKQRVEKGKRRARERAELVDSVEKAFQFTWQGRETMNGRTLAKIAFEPDAAFKPKAKNADLFRHVRGTMWIEENEAQLARLEAEIATDIAVFGGVFGKIYKGGRFMMEQSPVANGVWLPTRYEYDLSGRRFVFGFAMREITTASGYRRIGPPKEALAAVRQELSNGAAVPPAK